MEMIRTDALAAYGERAAQQLSAHSFTTGRRECRRIRTAERQIAALGRNAPAGTWYADNAYLASKAAAQAIEAFRHAGRLHRAGSVSAVTALAQHLEQAGPLHEERLCAFLTGARKTEAMDEKHACLFGAGLRFALLLELAKGLDDESAGRCFSALRELCSLDLGEVLEQSDPVDALLRQDNVYPLMDEQSRGAYRRRVRYWAKKRGETPLQTAAAAVNQGLHETLFPPHERRGWGYIAAYFVLTLLLSLLGGIKSENLAVALLLFFPFSELTRSVFHAVLQRFVPPRRLFRLALEDGIGPDGRTVCAVFALLTNADGGAYYAQRLEQFRLANRDCGKDLLFALVADLPEGTEYPPSGGTDAMAKAAEAIDALNRRYGGGFFLLTRDNEYSPRERIFRPHERKRGAMEALARLLCGRDSALRCVAGDRTALHGRFLLCLDSDSFLTVGSARALIGAALHPLNRPVVENRRVVRGHGLIHPRMTAELSCTMATDFARLHIGQGGTDPYNLPSSELLFDLYSRGGFAGKGLIDAECYLACMDGRIAPDRVLSHDTLEGAYLRGGYMGDVELTDTAPTQASGWFRRLERWTRGDWQNLPWLFARGIAPIDRFRLFDDLRRSIVPAATLSILLLGLWQSSFRFAAAAALVCMAADCLIESFSRLFMRRSDAHFRLRSGVLRGIGGALARFGSDMVLLPWNAACRLLAALTALWRMTVSHRRLLQWTPAGQNARRTVTPALALAMALGLWMLLFCPNALGRAAGLIWLATPLFTTASGWEQKPRARLTEADRHFLLAEAKAVWAYFSTLCVSEDGFLPPDNFQTQPPKGAARRASPTNLGLGLLSCMAALDLSLCPAEEALGLIERMLDTIESLPKWRGHLYNWYDTATRTPLQPVYVSTVDSGNFCACLLCLANGLGEFGRGDLAARARALYDATELGALYDGRKRLFYIGLDPVRGETSEAHYDLMASEARLTSYLAVSRGEVPPRHWASLGRAQRSLDGWRGLASWSGSVFEYLMPELFLPLYKGSLLWESAKFCLYAQRRHAGGHKAPWGNSESAFFSMDASLDWRYKAHGTGALALSRDVDGELVVAPYASFLALCVHPRGAVLNLRALKARGMWGRFGFYEALDLTPGRARSGGSVVFCFMAHHLGMSLAAIDNCLCHGAMRRRFMAEPCMAAFSGLLQERVPLGGPVVRRERALPREDSARQPLPPFSLASDAPDCVTPCFFPLSNGVYSLLAGEDGSCRARSGGILLYRPDRFLLHADEHALTPRSAQGRAPAWRYAGGVLSFTNSWGEKAASCSLAVSDSECGELRRITAWPNAVMTLRFEPVIAPLSDWQAHPAFWALGLECQVREGCVFIRRLSRGSLPELWLCLAATVPLRVTEGLGWQMAQPITVEATLPEGGCLCLAVAPAATRSQSMAAARRILSGGTADMSATMAALLGMGPAALSEAFALASALARPRVAASELATREALWREGISGDLPLVYCDAAAHPSDAPALIRRHALLTACGMSFDLVLDTGEGGDYLHPRAQNLRRMLDRYGLTPFENARGGIHFASGAAVRVSAILPPEERRISSAPLPLSARRGANPPVVHYHSDGSVSFATPPLPPRAWQNVLSNGRFGFIATDGGGGHMWLENAREAPVTPWENDPRAVHGPETLERFSGGRRRSLFADGRTPCRVSYGFGWARWEQEGASATIFVAEHLAARVLLLEGGEGEEFLWHIRLRMAAENADAPFTICRAEGDVLTALNPRNRSMGVFRALCSHPPLALGGDETAFGRGEDGFFAPEARSCFSMRIAGGGVRVIVCGFESEETLRALARPENAVRELQRVRDGWRRLLGRIRIHTPYPELDRMMNGWAAYQALCGRILARSSIYQSGGAYGFRDQLQDAVNLLALTSEPAREQILLCCRRQFTEGDVLHWWHESMDGPRGVRTRCSDDLLWLCWAVCEYTEKTGDLSLCAERQPWLSAPELDENESDRYFQPAATDTLSSVLDHARQALRLVHKRGCGPHGLLKMGSGDWNDGMDKVDGESVWLTMFCAHTAARFAALLERLGESDSADTLSFARDCSAAANRAWDGGWYLRGWWRSGTPLGAAGADECEIDSIAQSWAAFCPSLPAERVRSAVNAAYERLYDEAHGIAKLFAPPFTGEGPDPGYIRACGPGFRENGGQYTHGAVWLGMALGQIGRRDEAAKLLLSLLPTRHDGAAWQAEPYVLAADVSANCDHYGTANWSWYTGSAGWFFRAVLETLLGWRLEQGRLHIEGAAFDYEAQLNGRKIVVKNGKAIVT